MKTLEDLARPAHLAFIKTMSGSTDPSADGLPRWDQLGEQRQAAWLAVAQQVAAEVAAFNAPPANGSLRLPLVELSGDVYSGR